MILDARQLADGTTLAADIVIVGGGPAGIVLALELAERGVEVCLLEAGGDGYRRDRQRLAGGLVSGDPYPPLRDTRLVALGGASQLWAGWCRTLDPLDFARRAAMPDSGWPIDRDTLQPFHRRAFGWFGLDVADDAVSPGEPWLPLDPDLITPTLFHQGRVRFGTHYRDRLARAERLRVWLNAPATRLLAAPDSDRIERVALRTFDGRSLSATGRQVVLAAGGIENARLLLASGDEPARAIGNSRGTVGRWFIEHAFIEAGHLVLDDPGRSMAPYLVHGPANARGGFAVAPAALERHGLFQSAIFLKSAGENHPVFADPAVRAMIELVEQWRGRKVPGSALGSVRTALRRPDRLARALREWLRPTPAAPGRWRLRGIFECAPDPANRVELAAAVDPLGRPLAHLHWRMGERDLCSIRCAHALLDQALRAARLGRLDLTISPDDAAWRQAAAEGGKHHAGTTRMSADPAQGVVDRDLKVHGIYNLHVVGSSVFPTAGYANPTLTIVALAIRLADHLHAMG